MDAVGSPRHIALVAHDNKKVELLRWAEYNRGTLAQHVLYATGTTGTTNNGTMDVPSIIFDPVVVTVKNINETVIKDGTWSAAQICTAPYKAACDKAGIK